MYLLHSAVECPRSELLRAVKMSIPEDGASMFRLNVGAYLQVHTALQPGRVPSSNWPPWEPKISPTAVHFYTPVEQTTVTAYGSILWRYYTSSNQLFAN
jgi:hypothetical protein